MLQLEHTKAIFPAPPPPPTSCVIKIIVVTIYISDCIQILVITMYWLLCCCREPSRASLLSPLVLSCAIVKRFDPRRDGRCRNLCYWYNHCIVQSVWPRSDIKFCHLWQHANCVVVVKTHRRFNYLGDVNSRWAADVYWGSWLGTPRVSFLCWQQHQYYRKNASQIPVIPPKEQVAGYS